MVGPSSGCGCVQYGCSSFGLSANRISCYGQQLRCSSFFSSFLLWMLTLRELDRYCANAAECACLNTLWAVPFGLRFPRWRPIWRPHSVQYGVFTSSSMASSNMAACCIFILFYLFYFISSYISAKSRVDCGFCCLVLGKEKLCFYVCI